jgi:hypothetical protein
MVLDELDKTNLNNEWPGQPDQKIKQIASDVKFSHAVVGFASQLLQTLNKGSNLGVARKPLWQRQQ